MDTGASRQAAIEDARDEPANPSAVYPSSPAYDGSAAWPVSTMVVGVLWTAGIEPSRPAW